MARLAEVVGKAIRGEWGQDDKAGTGIPVLRTTNFTNEGVINFQLDPKYKNAYLSRADAYSALGQESLAEADRKFAAEL